MHAPQGCPSDGYWQELLRGTLSDEQQQALAEHVTHCAGCQQSLDRLASPDKPWTEIARRVDAQPGPKESALHRAMQDLKNPAASHDDGESRAEDELSLHFLRPGDKPGILGYLGSYEVTEVIGRGGMGVVLKALDPSLNRYVAIKVMAPQLATSAAARKRFAREARAAAAISHEHVVAIHAVDELNGLPYLVMEYVPGLSLQQRLDRDGPLELTAILRIGMQTAAGLAAAHAQGVMHRDIKPANILLENGVERIRITDFGLARTVDDASLTQSGVLAGTPQYMAPEQARGEDQDHRVDLFSLGSVLYALCTGRPPFRANTTMAVLRRVSDETPTSISAVNPAIPDWLCDLITRLHAKSPQERFQTAAEVAELMGQYLAYVQEPHARPAGLAPKREPTSTGVRRPLRRWSLVAAGLFILLGGLAVSATAGNNGLGTILETILRIRTTYGYLVVEVKDPDIKVKIDDDGKEITFTGAGMHEVRLRPGQYRMDASKDGKPLQSEVVTISRGKTELVKVSQETGAAATAKRPDDGLEGATERDEQSKVHKQLKDLEDKYQRLFYAANIAQAQTEWAKETERRAKVTVTPRVPAPSSVSTRLSSEVTCVAFSPDGRTLASAGKEPTIRFWKITSGASASGPSALRRQLMDERFAGMKKELLQVESDLRKARLELGLQEARTAATTAIGQSVILQRLSEDKLVQEAKKDLQKQEKHLISLKATGGSSNALQTAQKQLDASREILEDLTTKQREILIGGLEEEARATTEAQLAKNRERVLLLEGMERTLNQELERLFQDMTQAHENKDQQAAMAARQQLQRDRLAAKNNDLMQLQRALTEAEELLAVETQQKSGDSLASVEEEVSRQLGKDKTLLKYEADLKGLEANRDAKAEQYVKGNGHPSLQKLNAQIEAFRKTIKDETTKSRDRLAQELKKKGLERAREQLANRKNQIKRLRELEKTLDNEIQHSLTELGTSAHEARPAGVALRLGASVSSIEAGITALAFSPDGKLLAATGRDRSARLYDGHCKEVRRFNPNTAQCLAFSPDGKTLVTGGADKCVRFWDLNHEKPRHESFGSDSPVQAVLYVGDGQRMVSVDTDGVVCLWDAVSGTRLRRFGGELADVRAQAVAPDGKVLLVAHSTGILSTWDLATGKMADTYSGFDGVVTTITFSPDGRLLAAATRKGGIYLWNAASRQLLRQWSGHEGPVNSLSFSPDGRWLASGSEDKAVRVWDLAFAVGTVQGAKDTNKLPLAVCLEEGKPVLRLNGHVIDMENLARHRPHLNEQPGVELVITADKDVDYHTVLEIIGAAKNAGFEHIDLHPAGRR
jgi:serine/threonine protein kinase/WD40 repeat protein